MGIACLLVISFAACKKNAIEPNDEPQQTTVATNTGSSNQAKMEDMNGLYFGTYTGGFVPDNISSIDSVYGDVDSLGTTGYRLKIYSDRGLSDKITEFTVRFQTLDFQPCDLGTSTVYTKSWGGSGFHDEYVRFEVVNCNSIKASRGTYENGNRGGDPPFSIYRFAGERIR